MYIEKHRKRPIHHCEQPHVSQRLRRIWTRICSLLAVQFVSVATSNAQHSAGTRQRVHLAGGFIRGRHLHLVRGINNIHSVRRTTGTTPLIPTRTNWSSTNLAWQCARETSRWPRMLTPIVDATVLWRAKGLPNGPCLLAQENGTHQMRLG